jgi:hypothetical protein
MTTVYGVFPFGQPLRRVVQADRAPNRVFVLGVYSSAVHARWLSPTGRTLITASARKRGYGSLVRQYPASHIVWRAP